MSSSKPRLWHMVLIVGGTKTVCGRSMDATRDTIDRNHFLAQATASAVCMKCFQMLTLHDNYAALRRRGSIP